MRSRNGTELQRVSKLVDGALVTVDDLLVNPNLEPIWASRQRLA